MRRDQFEQVVLEALEGLPEQFRAALNNLDIEVRGQPSLRELRQARVRRGHTLFGTYTGIPLTKRGHHYTMTLPDKIIIYQGPHEDLFAEEAAMVAQVERTLRHEIGHYLGIDEGRLHELGLG